MSACRVWVVRLLMIGGYRARSYARCPVVLSSRENRPGNARVLVRERHRRDVLVPTFCERFDPDASRVSLVERRALRGTSAVDE